jgi:hypothetical protein
MNEHYTLEAAIYRVEEDLLLSDMPRLVTEEVALSSPSRLSFISRVAEFVRSVGDNFNEAPCRHIVPDRSDCVS